MDFSSFRYILLFLPVVLLLIHLARKFLPGKSPQIALLLASAAFYGWLRPTNLIYLFGSIVANWALARWMGSQQGPARKRILQLGLLLNIAYLCTFKYLDFFIGNIPWLVHRGVHAPDLGFPLGISFFTLTQIMYLVDCYEQLNPPSSLFDHATFVSFFPYVISGPISKAKRILHQFPQLNARHAPSTDMFARAMFLFSMGLVKKVILADAFSKAADYGFGNISGLSLVESWAFATAYGLQIYFDFSGYSDMAIASALMLGIEIPRNFDAPLRSKSIIEFWQRWHISLTQFITTYLYTPIVRSFSRATLATSAVATLLAMTIAGFWHGANWTFVWYGVVHGAALSTNQVWRKKKMPRIPDPVSMVMTILVYDIAFMFFRAPDMHAALQYMTHMANCHDLIGLENVRKMNGFGPGSGIMLVVFSVCQVVGIGAAFFGKSTDQLSQNFKPSYANFAATVACAVVSFVYLNSNVVKPFVYFKF